MDKKNILTKFGTVLGLVLVTYIPMFIWMWDRWMEKESYYGHGFLIPLVSLYIAWQRRDALKRVLGSRVQGQGSRISEKNGAGIGLALIVLGVLVHLACAALKLYFISGFTFVFVLYGTILFAFGKTMARNLIFPVFFLLAMVPLPLVLIGNLTVALKLFVAQAATVILNNIGFPAMRQGSLIQMQNSVILVEAPCSGLRSLISLITLGLLFAYAMKAPYVKKGALLILSVPIAMVTNMIRILGLCIVNELYGEKVAMGFFHDASGYAVFGISFFLLLGASQFLEGNKGEV